MNYLADLARDIWTYKMSPAPILATYFLFDLPAIFRRLTKVAYVPIYFLFFPSGHSDRLYAQYFNEDYMYCEGASMSDAQKRELRRRLQARAVVSMIFAAIVAPWLCGFVSAFYLSPVQFFEFLCVLIAVKAAIIGWVLYKSREESFAVRNSFFYVVAVYLAYLLLVWHGLTKAYDWTHANLASKGVLGLALGLLDYAYVDIFLNIVIASLGMWAVMILFTRPSNITNP